MALEHILQVLEGAMKNRLEEVDTKLLEKRDVQDTLTTFFAEQQTRPELVAQIRAPSLMYEYLKLDLEERREMERLNETHSDYLKGEGKEFIGNGSLERKICSRKLTSIIKKQRLINQLLKCFNFYLQNRKEGYIFGPWYLQKDPTLKKGLGGLGVRINKTVYNHLSEEGGFDKIIELASEVNPKIKLYSDRKEVFKIDGVAQLLRCFDFYLDNRKEGYIFGPWYLQKDPILKNGLGGLGKRITNNAHTNFSEEGGIKCLVQLAAAQRPEILSHWHYRRKRERERK